MTRKRSTYKPRPIIKDTMGWIKQGMTPISADVDNDIKTKARMHMAAMALEQGTADVHDLNTLISVSNIATGFKNVGKGRDWEQEIRTGAHAVAAIRARLVKWRKVQATDVEIEAVSLLVRICEAQLDDSVRADFEKARAVVARMGCAA